MRYPCDCQHEFQDKRYGKGIRIYNIGKTHKSCTVCGNKVPLTDLDRKKDKDDKESEKK